MDDKLLQEKIKRFPVQVYSRVVGWLSPVERYNPGKAAEYNNRKTYKINEKI